MSKPSQEIPSYVSSVFTQPPVFDVVFSCISPASLIRVGRSCHVARDAVFSYSTRAYNINRHLSRFFLDPLGFRSLQSCTGTLVSGSNALQFLDRTFYPESDLDIYVHPGHSQEVGRWLMQHEGYTFTPNSLQDPIFEEASWHRERVMNSEDPNDVDDFHSRQYRVSGIAGVYSFVKPPDNPGTGGVRKVQIIAAQYTPLQCILSFHLTCVMNFIAFDAAYSLYPQATFEERRALSLSDVTEHDTSALGKYAVRGWSLISNIWPHEATTSKSSFHMEATRWVRDDHSWCIPLDTTGVKRRPRLSPRSDDISWDPVVHNSWSLIRRDNMLMDYYTLKPTIFRYCYLVHERGLFDMLLDFFKDQGLMEHMKAVNLTPGQARDSWTWWDSALPGFCEAYLRKKDKEDVDMH